jgi:hypothetical protein
MKNNRTKIYTTNFNVFISANMAAALKEGAKRCGFPTVSSYARKLISLGMKLDLTWEE